MSTKMSKKIENSIQNFHQFFVFRIPLIVKLFHQFFPWTFKFSQPFMQINYMEILNQNVILDFLSWRRDASYKYDIIP